MKLEYTVQYGELNPRFSCVELSVVKIQEFSTRREMVEYLHEMIRGHHTQMLKFNIPGHMTDLADALRRKRRGEESQVNDGKEDRDLLAKVVQRLDSLAARLERLEGDKQPAPHGPDDIGQLEPIDELRKSFRERGYVIAAIATIQGFDHYYVLHNPTNTPTVEQQLSLREELRDALSYSPECIFMSTTDYVEYPPQSDAVSCSWE